ncbi:ABC transporter ATP-binding protein [Nocardia abscessus]|uniref:ABC transporter ATP-binding protein n=1 Tax=Nocardia abscessus TaxID=120957 RepID=UPI0003099C90|nr:ABC transporter ATP-binding protein [Nocardia abscessus]MCC3329155.1 ABC transporter ATP-binding protein [Nocardia abscessus]
MTGQGKEAAARDPGACAKGHSTTGTDFALELRSIAAGYGSTMVLHDVDLAVPPRSVVALLGPNGAGKSTLLRVASGLLRPRSGTVSIDGADLTRARPARRARAGLCLIPEGRGVFADLTVRENLRLLTPPWRRVRTDDVLDVFPALRAKLDQRASSLSGGQQQMLALGRAWLADPAVVLLDEVSMGLAPLVVDEIFAALGELRTTGAAIVLVEQYVDRALTMADHVVLLSRGTVAFAGPAAGIDRDVVLQNYLGVDGGHTDLPASSAGHPSGTAAGPWA